MKKIAAMACMTLLLVACGEKEKEYDATGTFEATEVTIAAKASGELTEFDITEGQPIALHAIVGHIDVTQLQLKIDQLNTAQRQLSATKKQLSATKGATDSKQLDLEKQVASLRQQINNARHEERRYAELVRDGAVARKQLDDARNHVKVLELQLAATQEQIKSNNNSLAENSHGIDAQIEGLEAQQAEVDVQKAQVADQIGNAIVKAPVAGTVIEKYVEQGEYVVVGKPLFKIADTQNMYIRAYVTSAQLAQVKVGQQVKVSTNYGDGKKKSYDGTVTWISSKSEFTPKTIVTEDERADLVYAVKIRIKNDGYVKIGMYGEVKF